jgi:hypothetical protein
LKPWRSLKVLESVGELTMESETFEETGNEFIEESDE